MYPNCIVDGVLRPLPGISISLLDPGFNRGYTVFEFLRTIGSTPLFLKDHVDRLFQSADILRIPVPFQRNEIMQMVETLITGNSAVDAGIHMFLTGGESSHLFLLNRELPVYPDNLYKEGGSLLTAQYRRDVPRAKTTNYGFLLSMESDMEKAGACEILYHYEGVISECGRSNIGFVDKRGTVITPGRDVLEGITRKYLIEIANRESRLEIRDVGKDELETLTEAFIMSTTKSIIPIVTIDGNPVGSGKVGPVTRRLMAAYAAVVREEIGQ